MNTASKSHIKQFGLLVLGAAFALVAFAASEAWAQTASDGNLGGNVNTASASTSPAITGVGVTDNGNGTVSITWNTDIPGSSWVTYGLNSNYTSSTTVNSNLSTSHSVTISGLTPGVRYHFMPNSTGSSGMNSTAIDYSFIMPGSTDNTDNDTSGTSTDVSALQSRVAALESQIASLQTLVASLQSQIQGLSNGSGSGASGGSSGNGSSNGTTTQDVGTGVISSNNSSVRSGTSIDFTGRGYWGDEPVVVRSGGQTVTTAHADSAGNFSTGSLSVGSSTGNQTYTFTGSWSGITGQATVNVTD